MMLGASYKLGTYLSFVVSYYSSTNFKKQKAKKKTYIIATFTYLTDVVHESLQPNFSDANINIHF